MHNLNLIQITESQALRLAQDRHHPPVYADKAGNIRLKYNSKLHIFVELDNLISAPIEPYFIPQVSPVTKTYLAHGKWDAQAKQRKALIVANKINPQVKTTPIDVLNNSRFKFFKPKTNKYGHKTVFLLDGTITDLFKLASEHDIAIKEISNVPHAIMRLFSFGDYIVYVNKNARDTIRAQELTMHLNYGK